MLGVVLADKELLHADAPDFYALSGWWSVKGFINGNKRRFSCRNWVFGARKLNRKCYFAAFLDQFARWILRVVFV